jgi:hypothetical protein
MTDWIEHTTDTCPVDPETVVEVVLRGDRSPEKRTKKAKDWWWVNNSASSITHYRIITPAKPLKPTGVLRREITEDPADWKRASYAENAKPPEPEGKEIDPRGTQMWTKFIMSDGRAARYRVTAVGPNGPVPVTEEAPEPEVTFKCPLLEDPEPEEDEAYLEEAQRQADREYAAYKRGFEAGRTQPEPDLITLRLECLKLAVAQTIQFGLSQKKGHGYLAIEELSDEYIHYVLNGSVDKA